MGQEPGAQQPVTGWSTPGARGAEPRHLGGAPRIPGLLQGRPSSCPERSFVNCRGVNLSIVMVLGPLQFWVLGGTQDLPSRLADGSVSQGLSPFHTFLGHHLEVSDQSVPPPGASGRRGAHRKPPGIWWLPPCCAGRMTGSEGEDRGSICCRVPTESSGC